MKSRSLALAALVGAVGIAGLVSLASIADVRAAAADAPSVGEPAPEGTGPRPGAAPAAAGPTAVATPATTLVGDAAAGQAKAAVCGACHGVDGNSVNPEWPSLAGQHPQYTVEQLALFKGMVRTNPVMQAQAIMLTPQDMADLAAYFSQQTPKGLEADPSLVEAGQKLWWAGDASRNLPSCKSCHGPQGIGNGPAKWPALRAQHSVYTYTQLKNYQNRARYVAVQGQPAPPAQAEMMYDVASRLTDEDMRAVASYVQGLR